MGQEVSYSSKIYAVKVSLLFMIPEKKQKYPILKMNKNLLQGK